MLVSFSVSNFRSFGQEETLNMVASNKLPDHPAHRVPIGDTGKHVLRSAVIYGANAAGKSNLVQAMGVAQRLILSSDGRPVIIDPFRFDREKFAQPSSFEFRFLLGERVFIYGFDVTTAQIFGEWLAVLLNDGDELTIFERDRGGVADRGKGGTLFFRRYDAVQNPRIARTASAYGQPTFFGPRPQLADRLSGQDVKRGRSLAHAGFCDPWSAAPHA